MKTLILLQAAATWALVGLIWTIQLVHYPLFDGVAEDAFAEYHRRHNAQISLLVVPLMLFELGAAVALLFQRPTSIPFSAAAAGAALVGVIWLSTAFLQVPQHGVLAAGFDAGAYRLLVVTNWIRTVAWTARGLLMMWILTKL